MREREPPRVERVTREAFERLAVHRIAHHRPAEGREMHADLVTAPRHEPASEHRPPPPGPYIYICEPLVHRRARRAIRSDDPAPSIGRVGPERQIDRAAFRLDAAVNDGEIILLRAGPGVL